MSYITIKKPIKPTTSGNSFVFTIPKYLILTKDIDPTKTYLLKIKKID